MKQQISHCVDQQLKNNKFPASGHGINTSYVHTPSTERTRKLQANENFDKIQQGKKVKFLHATSFVRYAKRDF